MSHLNNALLNLITCAEHDAARLANYRRQAGQLLPEQLREAASLGSGLGIQFAHLARVAGETGATAHAKMWHRAANSFFDAAVRDELAADFVDYAVEWVTSA